MVFGLLLGVLTREIPAFLSLPCFAPKNRPCPVSSAPKNRLESRIRSKNTALASGYGIASNYSWQEEAFEIDITVKVPATVKAKDVVFKATAKSLELRLKGSDEFLLDPTRKLRGRVSTDGTYWVLSDATKDSTEREITVTIEKIIKTPKDDFEVVDYDWKGIYSNDEDEVSEIKYDEAEALDVREYANSLGVDLDNINMSMVDKTMYSSGLNISQNALDELTTKGYAEEVTRQADGKEYTTDEAGERVPVSSPLGVDGMGIGDYADAAAPKIPFLDTDSPWNTAVPVQVDRETNKTYVQQSRNFTRAAFAEDSAKGADEATGDKPNPKNAVDPIDMLTVKKMKEILKSQGIKSSGSKKELQDRLRGQVNSLLQGKQGDS